MVLNMHLYVSISVDQSVLFNDLVKPSVYLHIHSFVGLFFYQSIHTSIDRFSNPSFSLPFYKPSCVSHFAFLDANLAIIVAVGAKSSIRLRGSCKFKDTGILRALGNSSSESSRL